MYALTHSLTRFLRSLSVVSIGMLPAHKSFVELLYQNQLMRVVIATETLAAGT
jgi:superfamily II RNA helicase